MYGTLHGNVNRRRTVESYCNNGKLTPEKMYVRVFTRTNVRRAICFNVSLSENRYFSIIYPHTVSSTLNTSGTAVSTSGTIRKYIHLIFRNYQFCRDTTSLHATLSYGKNIHRQSIPFSIIVSKTDCKRCRPMNVCRERLRTTIINGCLITYNG